MTVWGVNAAPDDPFYVPPKPKTPKVKQPKQVQSKPSKKRGK